MKKLNPIKVLHRLRKNSKYLQKIIQNGKFNQLSYKKRQQWQSRIQRLQNQLSSFGQFNQVRKVVAGAGIVLGLALGNTASAQSFSNVQTNPFGLGSVATVAFPEIADIDNDGDLDMIIGEVYGSINFYENVGDSVTPSFSLVTTNSPFSGITGYYFSMPSLVDIDDDGDMDLFVTEYYGAVKFYENLGTPSAASFGAAQTTPFGLVTTNVNAFVELNFADMDNDGDQDIVAGTYDGDIYYFENTGTAINAVFGTSIVNPFGMTAITTDYAFPALVDIDGDSDLDMFVGTYYGDMVYYENTGTVTAPVFGTGVNNPYNIAMNTTNSDMVIPLFADINDDGDMDLFGGSYGMINGDIHYQENTGVFIPNNIPTSADTAIAINQDELYIFDALNFAYNDLDGDAFTKVKFTGLPSNGLFVDAGFQIAMGQEITVANLQNVTYKPTTGQYGVNFDSFQFEVSDGFDYSTTYTFTIHVNALPTTIQTTVGTYENTDYVFDINDFTFNDPDNGTFDAIQIVTLPSKGAIKLNGMAVSSGQVVSTADFANLVFSPDPNETGFPYTDFLFAVGDGNGFSQPASLFIEVDFPISTKGIEGFTSIALTPNPVSQVATLSIETDVITSGMLSVQNITGQVVLNQNVELNGDFNTSIDVTSWSKGLYIVRLQTTDGQVWTEKLVVK